MAGWGLVGRALNVYTKSLHQRPIATQMASSALLWGLGDIAAQKLEGQALSVKRLVVTTAYGACFNGIVGHFWYLGLDTATVRVGLRPGTAPFVAAKVIVDSLIFGPLHIAAFFTTMKCAENGGDVGAARDKLKADFLPTLAAELSIWPPLQTLNFWRVPVTHQLLFVNALSFLDACFMSHVSHINVIEEFQAVLGKLKSS